VTLPLKVRPATASDYRNILALIDGAAEWLPSKGTDQWATPWPDEQGRNARVLEDLLGKKTWLAVDGTNVAATITIDPVDNGVWPADKRQESAVYVRRVIVDRDYGGLQVGARLLDWVSDVAVRVHQAKWIRVDVWTTNVGLHQYYLAQGFVGAGLRDLADEPDYPSRALFERSTSLPRPDYRDVLATAAASGSRSHSNGRGYWAGRDRLRRGRRPGSRLWWRCPGRCGRRRGPRSGRWPLPGRVRPG
jgi:predicted N-acetyltransferase YhbS